MGGKSSNSSSTVSIPPEVLARYNAVNQRADQVTNQPYQNYTGQFVAPVNAQQQQGISGVNAAANQAQPYYGAATGQLTQAQNTGQGYNQAATSNLTDAQGVGNTYANQSSQSLQGAGQAAAGLQGQAAQAYGSAYGNAQGYNNAAGTQYAGAQGAAQPLQNQAAQNITNAQNVGGSMTQNAYSTLQGAGQSAQPLQNQAAQAYQGASAIGQAGGLAAANLYNQSLSQSQGYNQAAGQNIAGAQAAANPLNQAAVGLAGASTQAVNASPLDTNSINQYMSPYLQNVVGSQAQLLNQGNQQAMAGQLGNAVRSGAFGGDRAGIAAANLNQQQQLANASIYSNLLNQGYNTALQTAQQQQGVNLGAGQANRAALMAGSQQIGALGQQQFGQGMTAAQQQAALGQQVYGQQAGAGQNFAALGQQQFGQGLASGQAQAALGQQQYAQGANTAAQQAAMGQQLYGQGMGAAQQQAALGQQQFGQANTTGQNMAALGQQQFGQGLAAGQAQQSLGQQQYAQGANTAAQQAALGQQQFGQGLASSQQQAAIGQQAYGQGANTSASLANLGLGAQNAALQGAQAQIGAGTLQQQTQQAQNTAEYNQFLQAQSLPYQQLAQQAAIAEGTGSLSGSTTTGVAPGGFFSDERLKEDIEPVGKSFDGQNIYKYRYKGDPKDKTQIGLIAQEVENKHPSAVGLAGGYKTVDYDKATDAAADRGHFYSGGLVPESMGGHVDASHLGEGYAYGGVPDGSTPIAPGLSGADMAALIQAQSAMYAPGHGGLYGSAPGGSAYGGSPLVPAQTGAVPHMMTPGELPKTTSPMEHMKQIADIAGNFSKAADSDSGKWAVNKAKNLWKKANESDISKMGDSPDLSGQQDNYPAAHGGAIGHYADGGLAGAEDKDHVTDKTSLDIPVPSASYKLQSPELPPQGKSGMSDVADIAKIAAMFMAAANGGRINDHASGGLVGREHHADANPTGAVGDDHDNDVTWGDVGHVFNRAAKAGVAGGLDVLAGINNVYSKTSNMLGSRSSYDPYINPLTANWKDIGNYLSPSIGGKYQPSGQQSTDSTSAGLAPPTSPTPKPVQAAKPPQKPPAPQPQASPTAVPSTGLSAATQLENAPQPSGGVAPPVQGALTPGSENNVSMQNDLNRMPVEVGAQPPVGGLAPQSAPPAAGKPSMIDRLKSGLLQNEKGEYDSSKIIPLLTGIAAMGTAPTRSLGVALASGVGAGAQAYLPTKQRQAQLAQTEAETATGLSNAATQGSFYILANGKRILKSQYQALAAQGNAPALMGEKNVASISGVPENPAASNTFQQDLADMTGKPTNRYVGDAGNASIENGYKRLVQMEPSQWAGERETSSRTELGIVQNAASAHSQGSTLAQLAPTLMKLDKNGVLAGGPLAEFRSSLIGRANDIVRSVGAAVGIDPQQYVIGDVNPNDPLALQAAANKLGAALQFARANGADQHSLGALEAAAKAVPSSSLSKPQAMQVLSSLYIDKQHALDQEQYLKEYKDNLSAMHPGMSDLYLSQNAMTAFRQEHSELEYAMAKEALMSIFQYGPEALSGKFSREQINSYGKQRGIKDLARFLENR